MATFWDYFSVLAPSVGLALLFWLVMRSLFRADTAEREAQGRRRSGADAKAAAEEAEAQEWARRRRAEDVRQAEGDAAADPEAEPREALPGTGPEHEGTGPEHGDTGTEHGGEGPAPR